MSRLPRLALATAQEDSRTSVAALALLSGLAGRGLRVQHFRSRAEPFGSWWVRQATGLPGRHLDAWLMQPDLCRDLFWRGMRRADVGIVEGSLEGGGEGGDGGCLRPLAETLALPTIAVLPCAGLADLHVPSLPPGVDAVILDGLARPEEYPTLQRIVPLLVGRPVIGAVEALPELRAIAERTAPSEPLPGEVIAGLGGSFARHLDWAALRGLAGSRPAPAAPPAPRPGGGRRFRVAYAHDEAFGGYFPDTLEMLEGLGAELVDFSPLRSEALPAGVDLVLIGCGFPDHHAEELAANVSMAASLRQHVCRGLRIYTEGGGTAYLGRSLILGDRRLPGAGILPFDAELRSRRPNPRRVVRTLIQDSWLGPTGTVVRGYESGRWALHEAPEPGDCPARSGPLTARRDLCFRHHAVGSLVHLHLASLPEVMRAFAAPHRPSLALARRAPSGS